MRKRKMSNGVVCKIDYNKDDSSKYMKYDVNVLMMMMMTMTTMTSDDGDDDGDNHHDCHHAYYHHDIS